MRVGNNPEKDKDNIIIENYHRIIIPVYIPNSNDYFKDSFQIFQLCIESLLKTIHVKTRVTIYNNNSTKEVKNYIDQLYKDFFFIDQVFHSKENVGKINAILAASKGNIEPLITVSDADVLFKKHWQQEVEQLLIDFPESGMVSPVPSSKTFRSFVDANWYYGFVKGKIRFEDVQDPEGLISFDKSLGRDKPFYNKNHLEKYLVLRNKINSAVMGCGHFVATLRREVFDKGSSQSTLIKIARVADNKFIDKPNQDLGFLRLATMKNYAYHMGNVYEKWMKEENEKLDKEKDETIFFKSELFRKPNNLKPFQLFIGKIIRRFLLSNTIRNKYFRSIGLSNPKDY